jgi:hypothetical protein
MRAQARAARIDLGGFLEERQRLLVGRGLVVVEPLAFQDTVVGRHVGRRAAAAPLDRRGFDLAGDGGGHGAGYLVLDGEDVFQPPVIALRPEVVAASRLDQLGGDPDPAARLADAAFHDVLHAEVGRHLLHLEAAALVLEGGVAGDHEEAAVAGELGDDVLGDALGEVILLRVSGHVGEGKDRDGGLVRQGLPRGCLPPGWRLRGRGRLGGPAFGRAPAPDPQFPVHVLEGRFAPVPERLLQASLDILPDRVGDADTAGLADPFQPRGDVHAVAEDVALLEQDVPEVDADAVGDAHFLWDLVLAVGHEALDLQGALNGVDHALELHEKAVARRLDDAPAVLGDLGVDERGAVRLLPGERSRFVSGHQTAEAHHVGGEYGGKSAGHLGASPRKA